MEMTLEIDSEGNLRTQVGEQANYLLELGGVSYLASRGPNGVYVVKMEDLAIILGEFSRRMGIDRGFESAIHATGEEWPNLVPLGQRVINGRSGTAYGVQPEGDNRPFDMLVISDDPTLTPLGAVFARSFETSKGMMSKMIPALGGMGGVFSSQMEALRKGAPLTILGLNLTDVSFDEIDDGRFALPSEPLTLDQIREQYRGFLAPPTLPARAN
jgi:hypothetical protein